MNAALINPAVLDEGKLVSPSGIGINRSMIRRISAYRAQRDFAEMADVYSYAELYRRELRRTMQIVRVLVECRRGRAEIEALPPREKLITHLEFRLHKLRHGLACVRDQDAEQHYEKLLQQAKRTSADDPGVKLAGMLAERV